MISTGYCILLARYNSWQNSSIVTAASGLNDSERWLDRGTFFKSIAATLNHLYWADALMLERINGNEHPQDTITHSLTTPSDWSAFKNLRAQKDVELEQRANDLTETDLNGNIAWYPLNSTKRITMSKTLCAMQLFNHQTHHRGQVHAMLTAAGTNPQPTDLTAMP